MRDKVFISYSHKDREWLDRLLVHLKPLMRDQQIDIWYDTRIESGSKWNDEIENALQTAKVGVLLISPDFLASDFIVNKELPALLHTAEHDDAIILPVILRPSSWALHPFLANIQAVNDPNQPLSSLLEKPAKIDNIFVKLSYRILNEFEKAPILRVSQSVKTSAIEKSETSKESDSTKIWFSDFLHPDPVAVKLAIKAFKSGKRNFAIEWHPDNLRHLEDLVELFEQSKKYKDPDSVFCDLPVSVVLEFIDRADDYVKPEYYKSNTSKREKRIPYLLEGVQNYYPYYDASALEESLTNYLIWSNFHVFKYPFYLLSYHEFRKLNLYPEEWLPIHSVKENDAYSFLFGVDERFYYARLYDLAGIPIKTYFPTDYVNIDAPKSMMINACFWDKEFNHDALLFRYVIPQLEWELSEISESKVVKYGWEDVFISDLSIYPGNRISDQKISAEWLYLHNRDRYYEARREGRFLKDELADADTFTDEEVKKIWGSNDE